MATYRNGTRTRVAAAPRGRARTRRKSSTGSIASTLCAGIAALTFGLLSAHVFAADQIAYQKPASEPIFPASQDAPAPSQAASAAPVVAGAPPHRADFGRERASRASRQIADWVVDSANNGGLPFVIVDKVEAKVFVFDAVGLIQGAAPALLGSARGDDSVPGIGDREFSDMPPETRTTPGGRFVAALGMDTHGKDVVWVDYDAAVSFHRVINTVPAERRPQRLASPTPLDNRISYGCINLPVRFYENVLKPAFTGSEGIVYVLPETRPARELFGAYDVDARTRLTVR